MTTIQTSTLRPGLLISLKTSVKGNVSYRKVDIEENHLEPDGTHRAKWETERTIMDQAEHEEATKTRGKCRSLITSVCSRSNFGLLCPEDKADKLFSAVREAQDLAAAFNATAEQTQVQVFIIAGRVAQDDVSAVRAINSEVRDLLDTMEEGLQRLDVQVVRDAANRAKEIGAMLSPDAASRIQGAIDAARSAARRIVKAAEEGVAEIDQATLAKIRQSRAGFLDLDEGAEVVAPEAVGRAIDLAPEEDPAPPAKVDALAELLRDVEIEAHPTLCDCPRCQAEYGEVPKAPAVTARSIELD